MSEASEAFEREMAELETVQGVRIWSDGEHDVLTWRTKPFLQASFPPYPDPWWFERRFRFVFFAALWILTAIDLFGRIAK